MGWKTMDVRDQRVRFVLEATSGRRSMSDLCGEFGGWPTQFCPRSPNPKRGCPTLPDFGRVGRNPCQPLVAFALIEVQS
jgi:hypothetical protein